MEMVRSCTSTFTQRFSRSRKMGTSTMRCKLRYPLGFGEAT